MRSSTNLSENKLENGIKSMTIDFGSQIFTMTSNHKRCIIFSKIGHALTSTGTPLWWHSRIIYTRNQTNIWGVVKCRERNILCRNPYFIKKLSDHNSFWIKIKLTSLVGHTEPVHAKPPSLWLKILDPRILWWFNII